MCRSYNTIGSLTTIKNYLQENNIHDFSSLKEVINFQRSFPILREQIISRHINLIEEEKILLKVDIERLETKIEINRRETEKMLREDLAKLKRQLEICKDLVPKNVIDKISKHFKLWKYSRKINLQEINFDNNLNREINHLLVDYQKSCSRYEFIKTKTDEAVTQSASNLLQELERRKHVVDGLGSFITGALGEQKVLKTLENLSDEFILINDFSVSFSPPLYYRQGNEYISSVQIDHLVVAPSGIFLIETKNWSEKSLKNHSLRSPVQQIKRASFALFTLLNGEISNRYLHLKRHRWGDRKLPIKNLIVFINTKPKEEFQYVKILTVNELLGYISFFKPVFSPKETQRITDFLLEISD